MARLFDYDDNEVEASARVRPVSRGNSSSGGGRTRADASTRLAQKNGDHRYFAGRRQPSYRSPNPVTPIPRRASASPSRAGHVRSRYISSYAELRGEDVTRLPTVPPPVIWQDEVVEDGGEQRLSLPSIEVSEYSPLLPSSPSIDELDMLSPDGRNLYDDLPLASATNAKFLQRVSSDLQFPLEIPDPIAQKRVPVQFPLEIPDPVPQSHGDLQFPLEIAEPLQRGDKHAVIGPVSFPLTLPDDTGRGSIHRAQVHRMDEEYGDICEQTTNPPPMPLQSHTMLALSNVSSSIDAVIEADTVLDDHLIVVPSLPSEIDRYPTLVEDAVDIALTIRARELLHRPHFMEEHPTFLRHPLDYIRWWLLGPGHLEFVFWLAGALLLAIVMCVTLVIAGVGLGWMSFGHIGH